MHISTALAMPTGQQEADGDTLAYLRSRASKWPWQAYHPDLKGWDDKALVWLAKWLGPYQIERVVEGPSIVHRQGRSYQKKVWAPNYSHPWLTLAGASRIGKTLLLSRMFQLIESLNYGQLRIPTPNGWRGLQVAHIKARDLESYKDVQAYARYEFVYLEDMLSGIASGTAGDIARGRTQELLDARTMRPTMICCNLTRNEIMDATDARIAERLTRDCGVYLLAKEAQRYE